MAGRKNGLGRGLDALFPEKTPVSRENVRKPVTKPTKKTEMSVKAEPEKRIIKSEKNSNDGKDIKCGTKQGSTTETV